MITHLFLGPSIMVGLALSGLGLRIMFDILKVEEWLAQMRMREMGR
jgi:hypothetical protein